MSSANSQDIFKIQPENSSIARKISGRQRFKESAIKAFFAANAAMALIFLVLIFLFFLREGIEAIFHIGFEGFIYSPEAEARGLRQGWFPTSDVSRYSILPLLWGTFITAVPAVLIASVLGILSGIYLSEIAKSRFREMLKPFIELFAAIPTVVIGFFMLIFVSGAMHTIIGTNTPLNALLASLGISLIVVPIIASITEETLRSIPSDIRFAAYALGAGKWYTMKKVIFPAAVDRISASVLIGMGRAVGETMIVLMAAGGARIISLDVFKSARTLTATIASEMGEVAKGSDHYYALFFMGLILFLGTFLLNLIAELIVLRTKRKSI